MAFADRIWSAIPPAGRSAAAGLLLAVATLPDLALRFILGNPDVTTVIPGMRRPAHVEKNLAASGAPPLSAATMAALRRRRWLRTYVVT